LSDIVKLLSELQLPSHGTHDENLFQIFPCLLWHLCIPNATPHMIVHIGRKAI
jgi:hypothetical protein